METSGLEMRELTEAQWEARRLAGADASDEVWDGEVVVAPDPDFEHQDLQTELATWLRTHWVPIDGGRGAIPPSSADIERDFDTPTRGGRGPPVARCSASDC